MITISSSGDFRKLDAFLKKMSSKDIFRALERYGREGVRALASATPADTGMASQSWDYEVKQTKGSYSITWTNSDTADGIPVVILLQYGHGTGTGGYVQGRDFINPAIRPIFDKIADEVWREVKKA